MPGYGFFPIFLLHCGKMLFREVLIVRLWDIYHPEIPGFLREMADAEEMRRLEDVGMNCGCEYTSYPIYQGLGGHSRYDHSVGVGLIVWHFTLSPVQAAAGLFHDISTPVFAHVVDFLRGDHMRQEATEAGTLAVIKGSSKLRDSLAKVGIDPGEVGDYHRFPVADNDTPRLSADRLEYTMSNMVNFGFASREDAAIFYCDLVVGENEDHVPELSFQTGQIALRFSRIALRLSRLYESSEDRYAMEMLAGVLRRAMALGVLREADLASTEIQVIQKLLSDSRTATLWKHYTFLSSVRTAESPPDDGTWLHLRVKRRYIDPLINGHGRTSDIYPDFGGELSAYLAEDLGEWLCGVYDDDNQRR